MDSFDKKRAVYKSLAIPLFGFKYSPTPFFEEKKLNKLAKFIINLKNRFRHNTYDEEYLFVGRDKIVRTLVDLLKQTKHKRGSYLIAGYRGAGKTSTINRAFRQYNAKNSGRSESIKVTLNLGDHSYLSPSSIYFSITKILSNELKRVKSVKVWSQKIILFATLVIFTIPLLGKAYPGVFNVSELSLDHSGINVYLVLGLFYTLFFLSFFTRSRTEKILAGLDELSARMAYEIGENKEYGLKALNITFSKSKKSLPVESREAEEILINIIAEIRDKLKRDVVFILDEIDKLSDSKEYQEVNRREEYEINSVSNSKIERINTLLGSIKYFITTAPARFFFIAGRETLDGYYSEKGSANSLYESLFDRVFEIPSLLTDLGSGNPRTTLLATLIEEYICKRIFMPTDINNNDQEIWKISSRFADRNLTEKDKLASITLRNFVNYLAFHSWGNPKRLTSIFESFVVPSSYVDAKGHNICKLYLGYDASEKCSHYILINANHRRSFAFASEIITLFQHQLSREVSKIGDKLTVSALSSLQFILKLHPYGFTRESLHRMSEAINIHRSPELNTIVDDLLTQVFKSYIRRVRNGSYRYRFNSGFEQELRYMSHVSELESASYNFSLDSMSQVKAFFEETLRHHEYQGFNVGAKAHLTLGDMNTLEQSYNAASAHYSTAARILAEKLQNKKSINLKLLMMYVECMTKYGDLEERRQNYSHASAIYSQAEALISSTIDNIPYRMQCGDSKWDLIKQPFWANKYLSLKRGASENVVQEFPSYLYLRENKEQKNNSIIIYQPPEKDKITTCNDHRYFYKNATLAYFLNKVDVAARQYGLSIKYVNAIRQQDLKSDERQAYIEGNALVGLVETILIKKSREFLTKEYGDEKLKKELQKFMETPTLAYANLEITQPTTQLSDINNKTISELLHDAANLFVENRLYISAAITNIKLISYWAMMLDYFGKKATAAIDIETIFVSIVKAGESAIECINEARQLESSQLPKTYNLIDRCRVNVGDRKDEKLSQLFEMILTVSQHNSFPVEEESFWQHSLWAQKLIATMYWAYFAMRKATNRPRTSEDCYPVDLSTFSVRSGILLRWVYARDMCQIYIDSKFYYYKNSGAEYLDVLEKDFFKYAVLTVSGQKLFPDVPLRKNEIIEKVYNISRNLYFALQNIRIISRKNLDLVSPTMTQIYFVQWKLLCNLIIALLVKYKYKLEAKNIASFRDITFFIQQQFVAIDAEYAPHERIAPTHFDFENIHLNLVSKLKESKNIVDITSRTRSNILQQKYYNHDDHNDQEFRLDWTLAHMFAPASAIRLEKVTEVEQKIRRTINEWRENPTPPVNEWIKDIIVKGKDEDKTLM